MFKVGDKVRVKDGLKMYEIYGGVWFASRMSESIGKVGIVIKVKQNDLILYTLDIKGVEDIRQYVYSGSMLELVTDEPKFKVGDKVRVKEGLIASKVYGGVNFSSYMSDSIGKVGTVKKERQDKHHNLILYSLDIEGIEDIQEYFYSEEMLELVTDEPKFKVGDKVRVKEGLETPRFYGGVFFSSHMRESVGKVGIVIEVQLDNVILYTLDIEGFEGLKSYVYSAEMLELVIDGPKFKVGDKVRVKEGLKVGDGDNLCTVTEEMLQYCGKEFTISTICKKHITLLGCYSRAECFEWSFTADMLELIQDEPQAPYELESIDHKVKNQKHYTQFAIQPKDFILANGLSWAPGNVIKYIMRYKDKGGLTDLAKAKDYIDMMIKEYKEEQNGL
jgi:uncharacterized protein YodC (DUF2158 family)